MAGTNLELPQDPPILYFAHRLTENLDTLYLDVESIPPSTKRNTTKKIYLWKYDENDEEDKYKWEVDSDAEVGPFLDAIAYEKEFDDNRENTVSMGGKGHVEVEYKAGKLVPL